jgi:hypothetical protein
LKISQTLVKKALFLPEKIHLHPHNPNRDTRPHSKLSALTLFFTGRATKLTAIIPAVPKDLHCQLLNKMNVGKLPVKEKKATIYIGGSTTN